MITEPQERGREILVAIMSAPGPATAERARARKCFNSDAAKLSLVGFGVAGRDDAGR